RTQASSGRTLAVSKCATCIVACTPASVRPAAVTPTEASATEDSARSSASCAPLPSGCDCQPWNGSPSYSIPSAIRMKKNGGCWSRRRCLDCLGLCQLRQQRLRFCLLRVVAFVQYLLQDFARAFDVAHLLIRLGEVELGCRVVPLAVEHRGGRVLEGR